MDFWTATTEKEMLQCINAGQNINSRAETNIITAFNTPLEYAVKLQDLNRCKLLVKHGAIISRGILALAAYIGCYEIVVFLVNNGANINEIEDNIGTPLEGASTRGNSDVYDFLRARGAFPTHTALVNACETEKIDIVDRLLRDNVKINRDTCFQPLNICAVRNNCDIIHRLFLYGIDINSRGLNGTTALMQAVMCSCINAVSTLIDYGADKTLVDDNNKTALDYATTVNKPNPEIIRLVSF